MYQDIFMYSSKDVSCGLCFIGTEPLKGQNSEYESTLWKQRNMEEKDNALTL